MDLVPVRIHFRLSNIELYQGLLRRLGEDLTPLPPGEGAPATYLWTVFFKVDGDTAFVDDLFMLQGSVTVVGTQGDHGDLPRNAILSNTSIPSQIGEFRTMLTPIPVRPTGTTLPGIVGCLAILIILGDIPAGAVAQGHQTLNSELQNELNAVILTLGPMKRTISDDDIQAMRDRIDNAVHNAIKSTLSAWEQFLAFLGFGDHTVGSAIYRFNADDLMTSAPEGIPLQNGYPNPNPTGIIYPPDLIRIGSRHWVWTFHGTIIADPLPISLRRVLVGQGYQQPLPGLRQAMATFQSPSVSAWIAAVR